MLLPADAASPRMPPRAACGLCCQPTSELRRPSSHLSFAELAAQRRRRLLLAPSCAATLFLVTTPLREHPIAAAADASPAAPHRRRRFTNRAPLLPCFGLHRHLSSLSSLWPLPSSLTGGSPRFELLELAEYQVSFCCIAEYQIPTIIKALITNGFIGFMKF